MTLPRKASRSIEVNGRHYRWMVKRCRNEVGVRPSLHLTVQDEETGELHQRDFPTHVGKDPATGEPRPNTITPAEVKALVDERFPQP